MANNIKNDTINASKPVASANAKPKIAYVKSWERRAGFLGTPVIKASNTVPIPLPVPMRPIAATPASIPKRMCQYISGKEAFVIARVMRINNGINRQFLRKSACTFPSSWYRTSYSMWLRHDALGVYMQWFKRGFMEDAVGNDRIFGVSIREIVLVGATACEPVLLYEFVDLI